MVDFQNENLTSEEAFWVMWYFLKEHYDLSGGTFELADVLSGCQPIEYDAKGHIDFKIKGNRPIAPVDRSMVEMWNEAIEKYRLNGVPRLLGK